MPRRDPGAGAPPPPTAFFLPDSLHFPGGSSPLARDQWPPAATAACNEAAAACGLLLEPPRFDWQCQPPRWHWPETAALGVGTLGWRLLTRPDWRGRLRAARAAPTLVRQDAHWWHARGRDAVVARHAEFAATAIAGLDDRALATHLSAVTAQYAATVRTALRLYTGALLALGAWLRLGGRHLRADADALIAALPPPAPAFDPPTARGLLDANARPTPPTDPLWGWRLADGVDPAGPTLQEDLALAAALARASASPPPSGWREHARALLDAAPTRYFRATHDAWADACALRVAHLDALRTGPATAGGLVRAAVLEAERRLAARSGGTAGGFGLSADALITALTGAPVPAPLSPAPAPPAALRSDPALDALLPAAARTRVLDLRDGLGAWLGAPRGRAAPGAADSVQGISGGGGRARGALVPVADTAALWRVPPGSVVLCAALSATVSQVPGHVAAIITRWGGRAALAAGGARSAGVPGVFAVGTALDAWPAGGLVEVDGSDGRVQRL